MKTILEFNDDERDRLELALHGADWMMIASKLDDKLRNWLKYEALDDGTNPEHVTGREALESVRNTLYELLDEFNVNFDL